MSRHMAVAAVKGHLSELLHDVERGGEPIVIERRGRPVAVIRRYQPSDERGAASWFDDLHGLLAGDRDFDRVMREVVRSRRDARPRSVDLDGAG